MHSPIRPYVGITLVYVAWLLRASASLTQRLMQFTWCLRTLCSQAWKACLVYSILRIINIFYAHYFSMHIRCYSVCTHNRIRSPRLAAFGRIESRWVREVGKFGPYVSNKDWLRRHTNECAGDIIIYHCRVYINNYFENWHGLGESGCLIKT